jgi:putative hydrolase of the HAD superfamily
MNKAEFLLLDLGGVILNIDYDLTAAAFLQLTGQNFEKIYTQANQTALFDRLEKGNIGEAEFYSEIKQFFGGEWHENDIRSAWNKMLLDLPENRLQFIEKTAKKIPIFVLSNTNIVHKKAFDEILRRSGLYERFYACFQKVYFSHEIGMRKPDAEVFEFILAQNSIPKEKILFVDDSSQHIAGAKRLGLSAYFLEKGKNIETELALLF